MQINDNFKVNGPLSLDKKYLKDGWTPYANPAEVLALNPAAYRSPGQMYYVTGGERWWLVGGTNDEHLVRDLVASSLQAVTDVGNVTTSSLAALQGFYLDADTRIFHVGGTVPGSTRTNTAAGKEAMNDINTSEQNSAFGYRALTSITTGVSNVAMGANALRSNSEGGNNVGVGSAALDRNTTGGANTAVGATALMFNTIGNNNTAFGTSALRSNTTGEYNTAVGNNALFSHTTGNENIGIGNNAGLNFITGARNILVGAEAGGTFTTGTDNICIGYNTVIADGDYQINIGNKILGDSAGNISIAGLAGVGIRMLVVTAAGKLESQTFATTLSLQAVCTVGSTYTGAISADGGFYQLGHRMLIAANNDLSNTAAGREAMGYYGPASGTDNTAFGYRAGNTIAPTGFRNSAFGSLALFNVYQGDNNSCFGHRAFTNGTGNNNTVVGNDAAYLSALTQNCTVVGAGALSGSLADSHDNTAIGYMALSGLIGVAHTSNVAVGYMAGSNKTAGDNNVFLGSTSGSGAGDHSNCIAIGANTPITLNQQINIGNVVYGWYNGATRDIGIGIDTPLAKLHVNGTLMCVTTEYADNAAAVAAGLQSGKFYRTGDNVKIVH